MNLKQLATEVRDRIFAYTNGKILVEEKYATMTLEAATQAIMAAVANGESVKLRGFGTFERRQYDDRDICDPSTGKRTTLAARHVVRFIPCEAFKTAVKGNLL